MPTTLPRTTITHTARVAELLRDGAARYPGAKPAEVLIRLAQDGLRRPLSTGAQGLVMHNVTIDEAALREALADD